MKIYYFFISILFSCFALFSQNNFAPYDLDTKIVINNIILAKVANKAITTYDVMKKLDILFNRSYPDLIHSNSARFQFYMSGWKQTLEELINNELILIEANKKELKITGAEIKEEVESKFGPNVITNLDKINLSYEEAMKLIKEDMIIQRMMYYFIKVKADQKITPSAIRNEYRLYCKENPTKETWSYYIISIKSANDSDSSELSQKAYALFKEKDIDPKELENEIKELEKNYPNSQISISNLYQVSSKEISASQQKILSNLKTNSYSDIICQTSRTTNKKTNRIFYLKDYEKKDVESFKEISNKLKQNLQNKILFEESKRYFSKLKDQYHVDINPNVTKDFIPFSIQQ